MPKFKSYLVLSLKNLGSLQVELNKQFEQAYKSKEYIIPR